MAWRVLQHGDKSWNVSMAAERRPNTAQWELVFSFRSNEPGQRSIWAAYPLASSSKSALFAQADRLSDADLIALLMSRLG